MKILVVLVAVIAVIILPFQFTVFAQDPQTGHGSPEPHAAGVQWSKDANPGGQAGTSPNLTWHGGPVQQNVTAVYPIFWGSSWGNGKFVGDKVSGLDAFYDGIGGSAYAGTNTEYTDASAHVSPLVTRGTDVTDLSKATNNFNITTPILNEVCKVHAGDLVAGAYYPVYVDVPRGRAGFCAWHSVGSCNGVSIQFAFFFNLDGDPGCDPGTFSGNTHSQGLTALANVSGHELSEMLTDPKLNAWYDSSGAENADKCAWTFGSPVTFASNKSTWKIQGNWSNSAYNGNTGYKRGCIDGN